MPDFETFTRRMAALGQIPRVTIQKRGVISLNLAAFDALRSPQAVELMFDRTARVMGLRPMPHSHESAHHVRATSRTGPWVLSATAFIRFYDIDISTSAQWPAYLADGVLCADLSVNGTPVTSNRAHRD